MRHWILFVAIAVLAAFARGQERTANVQLVDGQQFSGRVVAMDLEHLQLATGDKIVTIAARNIKSCEFATPPSAGDAGSASTTADPVVEAVAMADAPAPGSPDATSDAVAAGDQSLLRARLAAIDSRYPWLSPTSPTQWISLGLLLFSVLSLVVHGSARIVGTDAPAFARSMALAGVYLLAAAVQFALLPANDFATFSALIGNSAVVLFLVRKVFDLQRLSAFVAVAVQVGFLMLGLSILELVGALLGSVG